MPRDYSNIPAAIRDEQLESLRESLANATTNAASHRKQAEQYQSAADRERHFAERDEERARQWQRQLDFAEGVTFKLEDQVVISDPVTDAFVDAADAERYAQRDEYVNGDQPDDTESGESL
jgi:hypothetical protein